MIDLLIERLFAVADIPGIIENAHLNRGLGFSFLRHIERCRSMLYIIDLSNPQDPSRQLRVLHQELEFYQPGLSQRPHVVVGNKIDLPGTEEKAERLRKFLRENSKDFPASSVLTISAKHRTNVDKLSQIIREMYNRSQIEKNTLTA